MNQESGLKMKFVSKKMTFDMFINIVATAIPTVLLQLIILPELAQRQNSGQYGLVITMLSVFNVVSVTIGNVINNIRLVYKETYKEKELEGDFSVILVIGILINIIVVSVVSFLFDKNITVLTMSLNVVLSVLWVVREYAIVAFRIVINYAALLRCNLCLVIGYIIGFVCCEKTGCWQLIYIIGYGVSLLYIQHKSLIFREKLTITPMFKTVGKESVLLTIAVMLSRLMSYADKLLLYPMLGGTVVSIYYVATLFGKIIGLVINPISSVILTYLSKDQKNESTLFYKVFWSCAGICLFGYMCCIVLSRPVLGTLYPQYIDEAMQYIWITTGTMVVQVLVAMLNPFIMKFFSMKWQIIINGVTFGIYVLVSFCLLNLLGLFGFAVGSLITNFFKLAITVGIYAYCTKKMENT